MSIALVLEDDLIIRLSVAESLRASGLQVIDAGNPNAATTFLKQLPGIRVLVTDIDLGASKDGIQIADEARRLHPGILVVYISGRARNMLGRELMPDEAFIQKPFVPDALVGLLHERLTPIDGTPARA